MSTFQLYQQLHLAVAYNTRFDFNLKITFYSFSVYVCINQANKWTGLWIIYYTKEHPARENSLSNGHENAATVLNLKLLWIYKSDDIDKRSSRPSRKEIAKKPKGYSHFVGVVERMITFSAGIINAKAQKTLQWRRNTADFALMERL